MLFSKLLIFRSENNYEYVSRTLRHKKGYYSEIKITLKKDTKCYWDIWENNEVYYKKHIGSMVDYHTSPYEIKIEKIEKDKIEEVESLRESGRLL